MVGARFCQFTGLAIRGCMKHSRYSEGPSYGAGRITLSRFSHFLKLCYTTTSPLPIHGNFKYKRELEEIFQIIFSSCMSSMSEKACWKNQRPKIFCLHKFLGFVTLTMKDWHTMHDRTEGSRAFRRSGRRREWSSHRRGVRTGTTIEVESRVQRSSVGCSVPQKGAA